MTTDCIALASVAAALVVLAPLYLGLAALLELADGIPTEDAPMT